MNPRDKVEMEGDAVKRVSFSVPGRPFGKQRPKFRNAGKFTQTYTPKETVSYENLVKLMYQEAARGKRFADDDMLDMRVIAYFEIPASTSKKRRKLMLEHKERPTVKPDLDNIIKVIKDALNGVAYKDDKFVVDEQTRKFYSENPRVDVTIRRVSPGDI